jgi:hypothetical protein
MHTRIYRMPPVSAKSDLLQTLLTGPHTTELFVSTAGRPFIAVILTEEPLSVREAEVAGQALQVLIQASSKASDTQVRVVKDERRSESMWIQLQPELWVELAQYEVQRGETRLTLSAREGELLCILLRQPRCYVKAEVLAEALGLENANEPERPVETIISQLRRKLGELPYHPKLLRSKRYAGYAIFPSASRDAGNGRDMPDEVRDGPAGKWSVKQT